MATITTRSAKGSPLTNTEVDDNFSNLNSAKYESGDDITAGSVSIAIGNNHLKINRQGSDSNGLYWERAGIQDAAIKVQSNEQLTIDNNFGNPIKLRIGAVGAEAERFVVSNSEIVANESSSDIDFRVESNNDANAIFVNGANGRVGFGSNSPANVLDLGAATNNRGISWGHTSANYTNIWAKYSNGNLVLATGLAPATNATGYVSSFQSTSMSHSVLEIGAFGNPGKLTFSSLLAQNAAIGTAIVPVERFSASTSEFVVNDGSVDYDFRVETDARTNAFVVDGGNDTIELNAYTYISAPGSEAESGFTFNNKGGATGHLQVQTAENVAANEYVRANVVMSRDKDQIYWDNATSEWVQVGGGSTDWTMLSHTSGEFRIYHGGAQASDTRWTNALFKDYHKVFEVAHASGMTFDLPNTGEFVFNERGLARNFRVESNSNTHALFVDAGNNKITFFRSSAVSGSVVTLGNPSDGNQGLMFDFPDASTARLRTTRLGSGDTQTLDLYGQNGVSFNVAGLTKANFYADSFVVNDGSEDYDFRVESDSNTHALFVDGGSNLVYVLGSSGQQATRDSAGNRVNNLVQFHVNNMMSVGAYSYLGQGHNNTGNLAFNMTPDQSGNYWPQWAEQTSAGGAIIRMPSGGNGGLEFYTKRFGQDYSSFTLSSASLSLYIPDTGGVIVNDDSKDVDFRVESDSNTHALFVDASDNRVFIGKTSAGSVTTSGIFMGVNGAINLTYGAATASFEVITTNNYTTNGTSKVMDVRYQNASVGSIIQNTSSVTYNTTSDRRLKENIEAITDGTEKLMAMRPVTHTWIADKDAPAVHGFIAQEMVEVVPEAVSGTPDGEEMMSMDYGRITPVLVAALQDAHKKIAELEARLNTLEGK